ncbi:MAG: hypothetical protein M3003_05005 [Candidatus Dormibacteraeota bacterium]|nr:hypothetical protein [Candidatus Dormibacteraeota bacterium]
MGFVEEELAWDGRGITVAYSQRRLTISNYLEADTLYLTTVMPLKAGKAPPLFDDEDDEPFTYFELTSAFATDAALPQKFASDRELEQAVAQRAAIVRQHVASWLGDDGRAFREIGARIKAARLRKLIPSWERFVESVERGFEGGIVAYVAGVNVRGQIRSVLKWPGVTPAVDLGRLNAADATFERLTVPMKYAGGAARIIRHPRAKLWWRLPEDPKGSLRDHIFRAPADN